jgi:hypothetical protein
MQDMHRVDIWKLEKGTKQKLFLIKTTEGVSEVKAMKAEEIIVPLEDAGEPAEDRGQ